MQQWGGIGGLVYQFSPSTSKSEVDSLEDVLKDLEGPIGDNAFLKEKVKELAAKLATKQAAIDSLKTNVDGITTTKDALVKAISEKESNLKELDQKLKELENTKKTKKQEKENNKAKTLSTQANIKTNRENLVTYKEEVKRIQSKKDSHTKNIQQWTEQVTSKTQECNKLSADHTAAGKYKQKLTDYNTYLIKGIWYWASSRGIKQEDFSYDTQVLTQTINKKAQEINEMWTKIQSINSEITTLESNKKGYEDESAVLSENIQEKNKDIQTVETSITSDTQQLTTLAESLKKLEREITKADTEIETTTSNKTSLSKQIETSKGSLEEAANLLTAKSIELEKETQDVDRLKTLSIKLLENNQGDEEIKSILSTSVKH